VTISQTWDAGTNVMTAFKVVATDTASGTTSNLLDLQLGTVSRVKVNKNGNLIIAAVDGAMIQCTSASQAVLSSASAFPKIFGPNWEFQTAAGGSSLFSIQASQVVIPTQLVFNTNTILLRDGADNTLALRNGAAAQTFRVYNTFPGNGNNEFGSLNWVDLANEFQISTGQAGTGTSRALCLRSAANINFRIGGAPGSLVWQVTSAGNFVSGADNAYDIGASGANRPRNVYAGSAVYSADFYGINSGLTKTYVGGAGTFQVVSTGVFAISSSATNVFSADTYLSRNAAGVWQMGTSGTTANADLRLRSVIQQPPASITPASNGDYVVEATNNTTLTFRLRGSDGTVRSATLTLAP
jgi:hypothetical protein